MHELSSTRHFDCRTGAPWGRENGNSSNFAACGGDLVYLVCFIRGIIETKQILASEYLPGVGVRPTTKAWTGPNKKYPAPYLDSFFLAEYCKLIFSQKRDSLVSCVTFIVTSTQGGKSSAVHQSER